MDRIPRVPGVWQPVREIAGDGYAVEVGTYEAVPGLVVPAHVYRPAAPGPHPAVVHTPGHWMENARLEPDLQRFNALLARAGMVVLCSTRSARANGAAAGTSTGSSHRC